MRRPKLLALAAVAAVAALGVFVSSSIGGGNEVPAAGSLDLTVTEPRSVSPRELELVDTARTQPPRGASASRKSARLFYYLSEATFSVAPGTADLREIRGPSEVERLAS